MGAPPAIQKLPCLQSAWTIARDRYRSNNPATEILHPLQTDSLKGKILYRAGLNCLARLRIRRAPPIANQIDPP